MPIHAEKRTMPYSSQQMFDLVGDITAYPEFLPWCSAARIKKRMKKSQVEIIDADLVISFKVFREKFASRVTLIPDQHKIDVVYLDGPFKYLNNHWQFNESNGGCEVDFFVDFEFKSKVLQTLIGMVFSEAMLRIVGAFETRAKFLYDDK